MAILQENHQISKESKKTVIRQKEKASLVMALFAISFCVVVLCYWGAWHGGYVGLISMAGMCLWQGFARFVQKVLLEA